MKTKRRGLTMRQREIVGGLVFLSPWLVGIVVFFLLNIIQAFRFSINEIVINVEPGGRGFDLVPQGIDNYLHILTVHPTFNRQVVQMLIDMMWTVPLIIFFSLFVALLLNREFMCRGLVRTIFFLPVVMATPVIATSLNAIMELMMDGLSFIPEEMMQQMQGFNAHSLGFMLIEFGMPPQFINYIIDAIARLHEVIRMSGVQIIIFLAALQAIPSSLFEVAQIEGATAYETFWKITFPMVSPLILTNVVYTIVDTFAHSQVVTTAHTQFANHNFGISAAMSVVSAVVVCLFLLIVGTGISRKVFYQV